MKTIVIISMLHESAGQHSATRQFVGRPVLRRTLETVVGLNDVDGTFVCCWEDQRQAVADVLHDAADPDATSATRTFLNSAGPRHARPLLDALTIATRWCDGWRGGLNQCCSFDRGYDGEHVDAIAKEASADAILLVDPAAVFLDRSHAAKMIRCAKDGTRDFYFSQAPPGLTGLLIKRSMLDRLLTGRTHPGRVLHYMPDAPSLDPITSESCVAVPAEVARSTAVYLIDSQRQVERFESLAQSKAPSAKDDDSDDSLKRVHNHSPISQEVFPKDVTIELTTRRICQPIFAPTGALLPDRPDMSMDDLATLADNIRPFDSSRIRLAGHGDPLCHPRFGEALKICASVAAVCIETDLVDLTEENLAALLTGHCDVIIVQIPAMTPATYQSVMGRDAMPVVLENLRRLVSAKNQAKVVWPLIVPRFIKTAVNFGEMENWFDTWLRAVGSAVIDGPSDFAGQIASVEVADMTPGRRQPCWRIESRMTILSDGTAVSCEQDFRSISPLGNGFVEPVAALWSGPMAELRAAHRAGGPLPLLCENCRDWYRP